ncbi:ATP-binding protein [Pseudoalteromonas spongiae]|uniref:ATP-binding protein n=1 Tax=Pseudoalteromonas spongiae TaxID=298657 RepID=UPI00026CC7EB|nr:ATP-binding protein [Pseudoalteromonas spongiae]ATC98303.1 histidine kinase [Pseudoalteromonas spongiae UST010723-006]
MVSNKYYIRTDVDLRITEVNKLVESLLSASQDSILGQNLRLFFSQIEAKEYRSIVTFGSTVLEFTCCEVPNGYVFVFVDISSDPLANSDMDFVEQALNSSDIGVWCYDHETKEFNCTKTFKRLLEIPLDSIVSLKDLLQLVHADDKELFPLFFENHLHFQIPLQFEFRSNTREEKWFSLKGEYINNDQIRSIVGTIVDSSYEKEMVIALNEANESKQLAIEAGKIGTWNGILDNHVWRWQWDSQANDIFKMNSEDIGNLEKWINCLHPDDKDKVVNDLENSLRTGEEFISTYRSVLHNGELVYIFAQGRVGKDVHGESYRIDGVCIDQTKFYKAQLDLQQLNADLEERVERRTKDLNIALDKAQRASEIKSNFLAMMSHELRTPLNGIIGSLDLLENARLNHECLDLVKTASISANNLIAILNDVLDINKIEAGKLEIDHELFDVTEVIHQVIITFAAKAKEKNIRLSVFESSLPKNHFLGDDNRLRQILLNLVGNAIKFTGNNAKKENFINVDVSYNTINEYQVECIISVTDSGIGIKDDVIDKLFTPFTQAEKSTTRQFGGTGLGLSICGKLIDLMGGEINVSSEFGLGSEFKLKIPFWVDTNTEVTKPCTLMQLVSIGVGTYEEQYFQKLLNSTVTLCNQILIEEQSQFANVMTNINTIFIVSNTRLFSTLIQQLPKFVRFFIYTSENNRNSLEAAAPHLLIHTTQPMTSYALKQVLFESIDDDEIDDELDLEIETFDAPLVSDVNHDILLVEDNPFNQKLLRKQLQAIGLECDIADNGERGYQSWKKNRYKLILTDCHMPDVDGYEMTKLIRMEETQLGVKAVPIIAVTGATMNDDVAYCKSIGMDDFLSKPVKLKDIQTIVEKWYG